MAPELKKSASEAAYRLVNDTVEQVLSQKQVWWLTVGLVLTLWELSSVTRVAMTAMDRTLMGTTGVAGSSRCSRARWPSGQPWASAPMGRSPIVRHSVTS